MPAYVSRDRPSLRQEPYPTTPKPRPESSSKQTPTSASTSRPRFPFKPVTPLPTILENDEPKPGTISILEQGRKLAKQHNQDEQRAKNYRRLRYVFNTMRTPLGNLQAVANRANKKILFVLLGKRLDRRSLDPQARIFKEDYYIADPSSVTLDDGTRRITVLSVWGGRREEFRNQVLNKDGEVKHGLVIAASVKVEKAFEEDPEDRAHFRRLPPGQWKTAHGHVNAFDSEDQYWFEVAPTWANGYSDLKKWAPEAQVDFEKAVANDKEKVDKGQSTIKGNVVLSSVQDDDEDEYGGWTLTSEDVDELYSSSILASDGITKPNEPFVGKDETPLNDTQLKEALEDLKKLEKQDGDEDGSEDQYGDEITYDDVLELEDKLKVVSK